MVLVKWVVAMKPWCVCHHCVVIQSLHHNPIMYVCTMECVMEVCDGVCMANGVGCVVVEGEWWHLWLVAWFCHPHVCLFAIHHKRHSLHMPTFCCITPIGWHEDLVSCQYALVGCFVTIPLFLFQPQSSPLLSQTILSSHIHFFRVLGGDGDAWRWIWWLK